METAAYEYLQLRLGKREALALYYRLTGFLREHDAAGFGRFMAFREGATKDRALMGFVLGLMMARHQAALAQFLPGAEERHGPAAERPPTYNYDAPTPLPTAWAR